MSEEKGSFAGIIVAAYPQDETAKEMLEKVNAAKKENSFRYWDAAVIRKDEKGHYYYEETKDMSTPAGAGIGLVVGGLIGVLGGPAGVVLGGGLGAAIGGFFASSDTGLKDDRLEDIGHALQSSNSALIIISDHDYLRGMREFAADEYTTRALKKLTDGISEHMLQGRNVAYLVTSAGRSVSCHRLRDENIAALLGVETPME
jgi:uncharacterized membrane protein